ncbi:T5orf172 domain-containing protein [Aspergillus pseudotamarii]|uniref:T5orf172 domain-containing protein n=1 Tax=Aspergillus pseudotamarii TaxID=132259 RepID=A0A5N6SSQ0_ASPPS|nr:T5orf172 domain-containing protein [Aspergillus pseudotamarii]KAE8137708.1 T5orf172 domain-containing protein [Aspergillus pseudotamarii]
MRIKHVVPKACTKCLADGHDDDSRDSKIGGRNVQIVQEILKKITAPYIYSDDTRLQTHLEVLGQCVFCPLHRDKEKPESVRKWMAKIQAIRPLIKLTQSISTAPAAAMNASPKQLIRDDIPALAHIEQIGYDTSPFTVVDRCSPNFVKCTQTALKSRSGSPEGYVYAYEVEGNPGFVKIGYTGSTSQTRFKDIAFMCNRKPMELYPMPTDTENKIKNPKVVEALCHAQLREHQVIVDCDACLRKHREWFRVAPEDAIGAIQKWSIWMEKFTVESNWRKRLDDKMEKTKDLGRLLKELEGETLGALSTPSRPDCRRRLLPSS